MITAGAKTPSRSLIRRRRKVVEVADSILRQFRAGEYPRLTQMTVQHILQPGYDYADEF
jgi:hypothetical protein